MMGRPEAGQLHYSYALASQFTFQQIINYFDDHDDDNNDDDDNDDDATTTTTSHLGS